MNDFRTEKDSMGEMKIPSNAYYGPQTQRAVLNFPISGRRFPRAFIEAMGLIKLAAAETNQELGLLEETIARPIRQAAHEVIDGRLDNQFVVGYLPDRIRHFHQYERERGHRQSSH